VNKKIFTEANEAIRNIPASNVSYESREIFAEKSTPEFREIKIKLVDISGGVFYYQGDSFENKNLWAEVSENFVNDIGFNFNETIGSLVNSANVKVSLLDNATGNVLHEYLNWGDLL
jgi:hypothetical protein